MRPKWLILTLPALIAVAAILIYGLGAPSSATIARAFSAGQWKAAAVPGELRCALMTDLQQRGGPVARAVVEWVQRVREARAQWSGLSRPGPLCPSGAVAKRAKTDVTISWPDSSPPE